MIKETLLQKIDSLKMASYRELPDLDLYMDQVLALIARGDISFREKDKITSAMVNNYVKDGVLPRASGKRYTKQHLLQLMMLSRLKQTLCVKDAGALVKGNAPVEQERYEEFCELVKNACDDLKQEVLEQADMERLAMKLAVDSYVKKTVCELLLDWASQEQAE